MRRALDQLYLSCGVLAALFILGIALAILAEVIGRLAGVLIPAATEFAGYCLAASVFLGLAHTLTHGEHIRVAMVLQRVGPKARRFLEIWCLIAASVLSVYFAWHTVNFAYESFEFGELGHGLIKTPLWIPQSGIALGMIVMAIACVDELVVMLRGGTPQHNAAEAENAASGHGEI